MKFKFMVYKGGDFTNQSANYQQRQPEGSIRVESNANNGGKKNTSEGDYIDYEEVK